MKMLRSTAAAFAFTTSLVHATGAGPLPVSYATMIGLDGPRAQVVDTILESAMTRVAWVRGEMGSPSDPTSRNVMRAAMDAIIDDTEQKLDAVLSAKELERLRQAMAPPRRAALRQG
jgi:hypothetical protein